MHVRMTLEEQVKLKQKLLEDGMTWQELATLLIQAYVRGDRIVRLMINGHRDARTVGEPMKDGLLTQGDRDSIMDQIEKGSK